MRAYRAAVPADPVFIRPDADSKAFDGGVRSGETVRALLCELDDDLQIVIASPIQIDAEYRIFIVGTEIVAASEYRRDGRPSIHGFVPNAAIDLALEADRVWRPADAYVIGVGRSCERFGIVEANCITAARHYEADSRAIVEALCRFYGAAC